MQSSSTIATLDGFAKKPMNDFNGNPEAILNGFFQKQGN